MKNIGLHLIFDEPFILLKELFKSIDIWPFTFLHSYVMLTVEERTFTFCNRTCTGNQLHLHIVIIGYVKGKKG